MLMFLHRQGDDMINLVTRMQPLEAGETSPAALIHRVHKLESAVIDRDRVAAHTYAMPVVRELPSQPADDPNDLTW